MTQPIYIGTRKGLFRLDASGLELLGFLGVPVTNVVHDRRHDRLHVAVDHGHFGCKIHYSDDGGATFLEGQPPTYPPRPDDVTDVDPVRGDDVAWSTSLIWTIEAGHDDDTDALWCGTIPGGLFRSEDRGQTWNLVRTLWDDPSRPQWFGGGYDSPGIHSVSVDPADPDTVVVGVSCGGVWITRDRGFTWQVGSGLKAGFMPPEQAENPYIQDPHRIVRCRDHPMSMWTQHHSGMFRSVDGGANWTEIVDVDPSTFGFAVAAHPSDPDTAWFVPSQSDEVRVPVDGRMVVTRTTDGGRSFETLSDGLPQEHGYHLVYRHGLDVDDTGQRLVIGSTSGSLWVSDDAGDRFTNITNDLPPIAAVHFA